MYNTQNNDVISCSYKLYYHGILNICADTYTIEKVFFHYKKFRPLRELKDKFNVLNQTIFNYLEEVKQAFHHLIKVYTTYKCWVR